MTKNIVVTDSYFESVNKLPQSERKKVFETIKDLALNPKSSAHSLHSIDKIHCDDTFRSARVNLDMRIILSEFGSRLTLLYVDRHDAAYNWCHGKYLKKTNFGAEYIYDTIEYTKAQDRVQEAVDYSKPKSLLEQLNIRQKDLIRLGLAELHAKTLLTISCEDVFLDYISVFPAELQEGLIDIVAGKSFEEVYNVLNSPDDVQSMLDFETHRDTRRRFYTVQDIDELEQLMQNEEFEKWKLFLHPSQEALIRRNFNGPALIEGGPGTGKTVVGIHRAVHLAQTIFKKQDGHTIVFCTFVKKLAKYIDKSIVELCNQKKVDNNIVVVGFDALAQQLLDDNGIAYGVTDYAQINSIFDSAYKLFDCGCSLAFFRLEFDEIINKYDIATQEQYLACDRSGMGKPLDASKRRAIWAFFEFVIQQMRENNLITFLDRVKILLRAIREGKVLTRYSAVIVDEAQDFEPIKLRLLSQLIDTVPKSMMVLSDANQRIFRMSTYKKETDLNIVGRTHYLNINYRTTKQINDFALSQFSSHNLAKESISNLKSILTGEEPKILQFDSDKQSIKHIVDLCLQYQKDDIQGYQVAIICASNAECANIKSVLEYAEINCTHLTGNAVPQKDSGIIITTASGVKGLEFEMCIIYNYARFNKQSLSGSCEYSDDKKIQCIKYVASTRARRQLTILQ